MRRALALLLLADGCARTAAHEEPAPAHAAASASVVVAPPLPAVQTGAAEGGHGAPPPPLPDVRTDWCLDGWRGLDEGTCYVLPVDVDPHPPRLLIYLSGIVPPTATSLQKETVQRVVAASARRAGVAVLLPRGLRGVGPADAKDWWAWPTSGGDISAHGKGLVTQWLAARAALERAIGHRFERTYLAGSSSGAYFLSALALGGAIDVDGYAAASGGAAGLGRSSGSVRKVPFYVGYGTDDPTSGGPKGLAAHLAAAGWPTRVVAHPGGHGAREEYLDEAFAFWSRFERDGGP